MTKPEKSAIPRIPPEVDGIQTNFCKNPLCINFGRPASELPQPRGRRKKGTSVDKYIVVASGKDLPMLRCKNCGESFTMKSNQGIAEELKRLKRGLDKPHLQLSCPREECENSKHSLMVSPGKYKPFGVTTAGNPRFRCRKCGKSFTVRQQRNPIARQRTYSHLNRDIFLEMVEKMPFRCISSKHEISMETVYNKLDFFYRQCVAFVASRERHFKDHNFKELYISVDRQDYRLNWTSKGDRRNMVVTGVASAEKFTGYVLGHHLNYDSSVDRKQIEDDAMSINDQDLKPPFRKYARLWLSEAEKLPATGLPEEVPETPSIITNVRRKYAQAVVRADIDVPQEEMDLRKKLRKGMLVHSEYTLYAHFEYLKMMLAGAKKIIFYMDQESGIRAACFSAFHQDIQDKRVDAFYVTLDKSLNIDQKLSLVTRSGYSIEDFISDHPEYQEATDFEQQSLFMENILSEIVRVGPWGDEWLPHPFPDIGEPKKGVCWLTDLDDKAYTNFQLAKLFLRGTLRPVDRYFGLVRRKTSLLERPFSTPSSGGRKWFAYDPYQPSVVEKLIEIYRVFFNYVKKGEKGRTPAMNLGLAKGPVKLEKILYYSESRSELFS